MSADPTAALFRAVRSAILADATLFAAVGERVASDWGRKLEAPFIRLSIPRCLPDEDDCGPGAEVTLRVHVFTAEDGPVECATIAGRVSALLHDGDLTIAGHSLRELKFDRTDYLGDRDDPKLRMGIVNFTIRTTAN
jgi:hypothetical protein